MPGISLKALNFGLGLGFILLVGISSFSSAGEEDPTIKGKPLSKWIAQLGNKNRGLQVRASRALSEVPPEKVAAVVPKLIPLLKSDRQNTRAYVAQALGTYGPPAKASVLALLPLLEGTQYERNRAAAAKALGQILKDAPPGEEVDKAVEGLIKIFTDKYSDVRREAVTACGMIGPAAKACIPHLVKRYEDTEWLKDAECFLVREAAAWTCGRMGEHGRVHIDRMIALLHGNKPQSTKFIDALKALGPVHENVAPNVVDKLEKVTAGGYQGVDGPTLERYVTHCLEALASFGPKAEPAVDLMIFFLKNAQNNPSRLAGACQVLGAVGEKAKKAIPDIEKNCLNNKNAAVKKAAEEALKKLKG